MALALSFFDPYFFVGYLIGIAFFGLFQAIFMANAGGAWDNAKKIVEVDLKQKGTELHAATVVGDTVGDPFKDTSSVAMNPIIKFTTLFGLLAAEIAVTMKNQGLKTGIGVVFFLLGADLRLSLVLLHAHPGGQTVGGCERLKTVNATHGRTGDEVARLNLAQARRSKVDFPRRAFYFNHG